VRDSQIIAILAAFGVGIILIMVFALTNPFTLTSAKTPSVKSVDLSKLSVNQSVAEIAARDHLDKIGQNNGEQPGVHRGGKLGTAELIYVDKDGTNYSVDESSGMLGENLPYPIDGSNPDQYIWRIALNYGNSTKPEYIYAVDGSNGTAWMIGIID
jgi:hypothetical protein